MATNSSHPTPSTYARRRHDTEALGKSLHATEFAFLLSNCNYLDESVMPFDLTSNKLSGLPLRGYFFRNLFNLAQKLKSGNEDSKNLLFSTQLPFIAETIICIQYYSNQILDNKGGVTTKARIDENLNIKDNLEPALYDYIWQRVFLNDAMRCDLVKTVRQILRLGATGQVLEDKYTTYKTWLRSNEQKVLSEGVENYFDQEILILLEETVYEYVYFPEDKRPFLKTYLQKIYLRNAVLYDLLTDFMVRHADLDQQDQARLRKFAVLFALMHQIVNDLADLVPSDRQLTTQQKTHKDAFADLRNDTITLPMMIHLLTVENSLMENLLKEKVTDLSLVPEEALLDELTQHHAVFIAMSIAKAIQKKAAAYLPSKARQPCIMFLDMLRIAENNKYFRHFYDKEHYYRAYRKTCKKTIVSRPLTTKEECLT